MYNRSALSYQPHLKSIQRGTKLKEKDMQKTNLKPGACPHCGKEDDLLYPVSITLCKKCASFLVRRNEGLNILSTSFSVSETCDRCLQVKPGYFAKVNYGVCGKCLTKLGRRDGRYKNDKKHNRIKRRTLGTSS